MSKFYCEYCNFRSIRENRLIEHIKIHDLENDFNWKFYLEYYEDLRNAGINNFSKAYDHWKKHGKKEGRICNKNKIKKYISEKDKLIKVAFVTNLSEIDELSVGLTNTFQKGDNNYLDKIVFVKSLKEATHVVLINTITPKLNIPKENVIGIAWEPNEFLNLNQKFFNYAMKNMKSYYIGDVLQNYPSNFKNSYTFLTPVGVRDDYFKKKIPEKTKKMSIIFSRKTKLNGHKYRHKLVDMIVNSDLNIDIYGYGCRKFGNRKDSRIKGSFDNNAIPMKDYKFTISVENSVHPDYISEKFMNAIAFNTVPIYYGGNNIEKYFGKKKCYYRLIGDIETDMKLIKKIYDNIDNHLLDLSEARYNLFEGNAYLMKFLYDIWAKKVTCNLMGGLGNQLFQIFTTICYGLENNKKFVFTNKKKLVIGPTERKTYWDTFLKELKVFTESKINISKDHIEKNFNYSEIPYYSQSIKLSGYFQSAKYFNKHQNKIYEMIKLNDNKKLIKNKCNYLEGNTISLHFRIGDYIKLQNIHPILDLVYYEKSLEYIINQTKIDNFNILYFCEEKDNNKILEKIRMLKKKFINLNFKKVSDKYEDWEQLIIMSLTNHNIIANSSFSWWGSYLNENKDKIVCFPCKWFGSKVNNDIKDLIYQNCKVIKY